MSKTALQSGLAAGALGLIAALSVLLQEPLLAPSLASAMFVQVMTPGQPTAKPWNTAVGQLVGLAAGLIGVYVSFATTVPMFMGDHPLVWARVLAVVIAVVLKVVGQTVLKAFSPAGGATALVIAIGAEMGLGRDWPDDLGYCADHRPW